MRRALVPLIAAIGTCLLAGSVSPAAAVAASCKGRDLVRGNPAIKVVHRTFTRSNGRRGHRYVVCAPFTEYDEPYELDAFPRGDTLEFPSSIGASLAVRHVRTGAVRLVGTPARGYPRLRSDGRHPAGPVVVAQAGEAAAVFRSAGGGAKVVGFDYDGTAYTLDSGAVDVGSLRRERGSVVTWTKAGVARTADLAEPAVPCEALAGKRVLRTAHLRIVSFQYTSEEDPGMLNGGTTRTRACPLAGGPARVVGERTVYTDGQQGGYGFRIRKHAGTFLIVEASSSDSQGDGSVSLFLHGIATGKRFMLAQADQEEAAPRVPLLTPGGQTAYLNQGSWGSQVSARDANGENYPLDRADPPIPIGPLSLSGTVLSWTRDGEPRSADLALLAPAAG